MQGTITLLTSVLAGSPGALSGPSEMYVAVLHPSGTQYCLSSGHQSRVLQGLNLLIGINFLTRFDKGRSILRPSEEIRPNITEAGCLVLNVYFTCSGTA